MNALIQMINLISNEVILLMCKCMPIYVFIFAFNYLKQFMTLDPDGCSIKL